ncbi:ABC transporter ATP-binding protein [Candidatus Berkelbacteria bacterium]|nr:ABC transporter ATP-binding protein [Candidatus Berkelbacteria bacterium]
MSQKEPALEIKSLTKRYSAVTAVHDLTLTVQAGEFFGFLGPNGAGKSSTIHCVTGIATITSGKISIFGYDAVVDYRQARQQIGLSPQEFNVDIFLSTRKILDYMGGYYGMPSSKRRQRIDELLERFNLSQHADKKFQTLSGGLKRRVILARALIHDPKLLILDEPTAGVDVELRLELWRYLKELNREGKTIILTSHYLEEIEKLCYRVAIISQGQLVANDTLEKLTKGSQRLEDIYLNLTRSMK